MLKKEKFLIRFVIITSIIALFVLIFFCFSKTLNVFKKVNHKSEQDTYFLNEKFKYNNDPYITLNPKLEDMLDGPIISTQDPQTGDSKAFVSIVEFSDYECDFCAKQEQVLKRVLEKYQDKARLIWKDYPDDVDSVSYQAAIAARCAQEQEMFWPYHDLLFEFNDHLNNEKYIDLAKNLDLKINEFKKCLSSDKVKQKINDNIKEANALQITGIPFIYVNDKEIMGEIDEQGLSELIENELSK